MNSGPEQWATIATWAMTGAGLGLWLWSWFGARDPIRKQRFNDCAVVLVFASLLARIVIQDRAPGLFSWVMLVLGPVFIGAALWRLGRTGAAPK